MRFGMPLPHHSVRYGRVALQAMLVPQRPYFTTSALSRSGRGSTSSSSSAMGDRKGEDDGLWGWDDPWLAESSQKGSNKEGGGSNARLRTDTASAFSFSSSSYLFFHAAGAVHDMDVGRVNDELMCQFHFITTAWQTAEQQQFSEGFLTPSGANSGSSVLFPASPSRNNNNNNNNINGVNSTMPGGGLLRPFLSRKEQLLVRCSGSEAFLRALAPLLAQNGTMVEIAGTITLHPTVAALHRPTNGSVVKHFGQATATMKNSNLGGANNSSNNSVKNNSDASPLSLSLCRYTHIQLSQRSLGNGTHALRLLQKASSSGPSTAVVPEGGEEVVCALARELPLA